MARTSITARARDRVLSNGEIKALWQALQQIPYPFGPFVQLLLLTAQRRDEIAHMRWREIDGDLWTIPRQRYENGRANAVPLTEEAQSILAALPRSGEFVFSTTGRTLISGFSKSKAAIDRASGVTGWRLHDLRRTARSLMSRTGVSSEIAERDLGHAIPGVAGVYDRHDYVSAKRDALRKLAAKITRIVA